jgi:hypothetical protein
LCKRSLAGFLWKMASARKLLQAGAFTNSAHSIISRVSPTLGIASAVPTIWAKCFALTTQKFNKGRTKPNLSPNGDRSGYKFRSVQGRGQAFFGETSWNGTRPPHSQSQALWAEPLAGSSWNGTRRDEWFDANLRVI